MYCPACDKEFSPVHSRCPECKGWLRVSGPTVGAKAGGTSRPAVPLASDNSSSKTTPVTGANVALPSRPVANKGVSLGAAGPSAPAATAPTPSQTPPASAGWGASSAAPTNGWGLDSGSSSPSAEATARGGLGSGWEGSSSFGSAPAPTAPPAPSGWGTPAAEAPPAPAAAGWGAAAPPAAPGLGWPQSTQETGKMPAWGSAGGLGTGHGTVGGHAQALGSTPTAGASNGFVTPAPSAVPATPSQGLGGWLGDAGSAPSPYGAPTSKSGGWLGDNGGGGEPAPLAMPSIPTVETVSDGPALELPDHTVAVDLGTPWEDEAPQASSNKAVYLVLAAGVLALLGFFGYLQVKNRELKKPLPSPTQESTAGALELGENYIRQAEKNFASGKFQLAYSDAKTAHTLIAGLKVASAEKKKQVKSLYSKTTNKYAGSLLAQAGRAKQAGDTNKALGLAEEAAAIYSEIPASAKYQAQARAFRGGIYMQLEDYPAAESEYRKAHSLNASGGYAAAANGAKRRMSSAAAPPPETSSGAPAPVVQPSLGDDEGLYPSGSPGSGRRPSAPAQGAAPAAPGAAPVRRPPPPAYVPKKRDDTPSWRKRKSDVLPTY